MKSNSTAAWAVIALVALSIGSQLSVMADAVNTTSTIGAKPNSAPERVGQPHCRRTCAAGTNIIAEGGVGKPGLTTLKVGVPFYALAIILCVLPGMLGRPEDTRQEARQLRVLNLLSAGMLLAITLLYV